MREILKDAIWVVEKLDLPFVNKLHEHLEKLEPPAMIQKEKSIDSDTISKLLEIKNDKFESFDKKLAKIKEIQLSKCNPSP